MVTQLNKKDHNAIVKRRKKYAKNFKKEMKAQEKLSKKQPSQLRLALSFDNLSANLVNVISWIGLDYLVRNIWVYVGPSVPIVARIIRYAGFYGTIAAIGLYGVVFIIKEYGTIKELDKQRKAGTLKDLEGKPIKTKKKFLEAVVFSTVGVKDVRVEKFVDHLLKIEQN